MQAGIHHQAAGAHLLSRQVSQLAKGIVCIHADLVGQLFGIQGPAFDIGVEAAEQDADQRQLARLRQVGALPGMAGNAFMMGKGGQRVFRPGRDVLEVDVIDRRPRPIQRTGIHVALGGAILDVGRHAFHQHGRLQPQRRQPGHLLAALADQRVEIGDNLVAARVILREQVPRIMRQGGHALTDRALAEALLPEQAIHARFQFGILFQAHLVDLVGRHRRAGADLQQPVVIGPAILQLPHACVVGGFQRLQRRALAGQRRQDLVGGDFGGLRCIIANRLGLGRQRRDDALLCCRHLQRLVHLA